MGGAQASHARPIRRSTSRRLSRHLVRVRNDRADHITVKITYTSRDAASTAAIEPANMVRHWRSRWSRWIIVALLCVTYLVLAL